MAEKVLPPPLYNLIPLAGVVLLGFVFPFYKIIPYPFNLLGIPFIIAGLVIMGSAGMLFLKYKTTLDPNHKSKKLVVDGSYKLTRNPMYLGIFLVLFGVAIISGCLLSILSSFLVIILMNFIIIPFEEKVMERTFGKQYLAYKQKVRRWI